jgi:hypothetical protein
MVHGHVTTASGIVLKRRSSAHHLVPLHDENNAIRVPRKGYSDWMVVGRAAELEALIGDSVPHFLVEMAQDVFG